MASLTSVLSMTKDEAHQRCRNDFERFFLWGQGLSIVDGDLDEVLAHSKELHFRVLTLLLRLGTVVLQGLSRDPVSSSQALTEQCDDLRTLLDTTETMLQEPEPNESARPYMPSESDASEYKTTEILDEISIYIDCLLDLSPSLDNPALDIQVEGPDEPPTQAKESFTVSSEEALIYCRKIRDRFEDLPKYLVERLAEANVLRAAALREMRSRPTKHDAPISDDIAESLFSTTDHRVTETTKSTSSVFPSAMEPPSRWSKTSFSGLVPVLEFDTPQADPVASVTESAQMGGCSSPRLRTQEKAHNQASRMPLPEFRRKCCFRWPSGGGSNRLFLEPGQGPKLGKYLGTVGWSQKSFIAAFEVTKEYGFEDRLAAKEVRCTEDDEKRKIYQEILNFGSLDHNHIIAFLGSYIQGERIGILMFPVASYNLQEFMDVASTYNKNNCNDPLAVEHEHIRLLRIYPACLCQALKYLHEVLEIKHKNIKPENILIDRHDSVIITDFGITTTHAGSANPVTCGPTGYTVKYGAPEVIHGQEEVGVGRDYDIDIFSLGCVWLEMANVIYGEPLDNMYQVIGKPVPQKDGGPVVAYHECAENVRWWISHLLKKKWNRTMVSCPPSCDQLGTSSVTPVQSFDREMFNMILKMMSENPKERPSLQTVWELLDTTTSPCPQCHPSINSDISNQRPRRLASIMSLDPNDPVQDIVSSDNVPKLTLTDATAKATASEHNRGYEGFLVDTSPEPISVHNSSYKPSLQGPASSSSLPQMIDGVGMTPAASQTRSPSPPMRAYSPDLLSVSYQPPGPIIRVFSLGRNPNIRELPQEKIDDEILMCTEEKKIVLLNWRMNGEDLTNGVLMQIPHRDRNMRTPQGDLDLWKLVSFPLNTRRFFGRLNLVFFRGNYPDSQLLRMPGRPDERHTIFDSVSRERDPKSQLLGRALR